MKASMVRSIVAVAVYVSLLMTGCTNTPNTPTTPCNNCAQSFFTITKPAAGDSAALNANLTVAWTSSSSLIGTYVTISLYKGDKFMQTLVSNVGITGSDSVIVRILSTYAGSGTDYRLRIISSSDTGKYVMGSPFKIYSGYSGTYTLTSPTIDSSWTTIAHHYIRWDSTGSPGAANIYLYHDTVRVATIATSAIDSGSYSWLIPFSIASGTHYRIVMFSSYDRAISDTGAYFTITAGSPFMITSPTVDSSWMRGANHTILWNGTGSPATVTIALYKATSNVSTIVSGVTNNGAYSWYIPAGIGSGSNYRIRISSSTDTSSYVYSDSFTIASGYTGTYTITSPTVDSSWSMGNYHYILWTSTGSPGTYVNIYLYDSTALVSVITTGATNSGSYYGYIPNGLASGAKYRIVVTSYSDVGISDTSAYFRITSQYSGSYTITSPTAASSWTMGNYYYIQWTSTGSPGAYVNIDLYNGTTYAYSLVYDASNSGSYDAYIPTGVLLNGTQYRIVISSYYDATISDTSAYFSITSQYSGSFTITSPTSGSSWDTSAYLNIQWNYTGSPGADVYLELYNDSTFVDYYYVTNSGSYSWYLNNTYESGTHYRIFIYNEDESIVDSSDYFTINGAAPIDTNAYEPDGSPALATAITTDGITQGHYLTYGDNDWLKFNAVSGTTYIIRTFGYTDTYMYLYDTDGVTEITYDDDDGGNLQAMITWTCTTSGTYYFMVKGYAGIETGPYLVSVTAQ
ncbi:MAG: Ser-Thr-rich GPI-anchored membrane family protein [Chitinispirillaceae bacterium]|jgi:hypothetical protein